MKSASSIVASVRVATTVPNHEVEHILKLKEHVGKLFDELRQPVYRYLLCLGIRSSQAEEIAQETFLRLYRYLHEGGETENVRGWIFRVAHNIAINELKRKKYSTEKPPEFWTSSSMALAESSPGPEEILLLKEKMLLVQATFEILSEQQKQCIFLRAEGLRYREIAEVLDVSISTVTESLRRAIKKLTRGPDA